MFQPEEIVEKPPKEDSKIMNKYKNYITNLADNHETTTSIGNIERLLEKEKTHMSTEPWNKLDKRLKIQKLHAYAEKYGHANSLPIKEIKALKLFFSDCLTKDKLAKVKDVEYDKETGIINSISGLFLNASTRTFTLKSSEKKVSTLKSLTPKKITTIAIAKETEN